MDLPSFNSAPAAELTAALLTCCDVPAWAATVGSSRPYADIDSLLATADEAARSFTPAEVERALAAHPRIGERADRPGAEADWSRQEQSGVRRDGATQRALAAGNRAYEDRFGRVFLICAAGRSGAEILDSLNQRLANDDQAEAAVVAGELRAIALQRLRRVVGS